ncbi:alpha/beta fold hydrolase [Patulibacter brassicae]|jgi:3-oxoadipate enol-lactonase|uniref:Alpha/beta fold hydrolase n=1 Tax=Patulibacter brassicae TaxID=1705717 RepID=A0ABU4VSC5_9ACTN|nr:alpha/beta fold hydrolase [Patulibacter brassicae]MDX8153841.1 alpha/beta fold hydrolase [Patulibacter brassicae]
MVAGPLHAVRERVRRPRVAADGIAPAGVPEPPFPLPPARLVHVPGRGELFVRDTGEDDRPAVVLLHGWMFSADANWFTTYDAVRDAGYRVIAMDHRGHGRGLRTTEPFRLRDCADDVAALLDVLEVERPLVVGYSMGGAIAQLLARHHGERIAGIVLGATASDWQEPQMRLLWTTMAALRVLLGVAPEAFWRRGMRLFGAPDSATTTWIATELTRGSARDMAEAGRELGRYDARPWLGELALPAATIVTVDDGAVPPRKQRELAARVGGPVLEVPGDHGAVTNRAREFNVVLLSALAALGAD